MPVRDLIRPVAYHIFGSVAGGVHAGPGADQVPMDIDLRSDGRATSTTIEISAAATSTAETSIFLLTLRDPSEKCSGFGPASVGGESGDPDWIRSVS